MKKILFLLIMVVLATGVENVKATDYTHGPGDHLGGLGLVGTDTLLMTGGTIESLAIDGNAIAYIENTSSLGSIPSDGGVWHIGIGAYGILNLSGGEINEIVATQESINNIYCGSVNSLEMHYKSMSHLYGGTIGTLASDQLLDVEPWWPDAWIHIYCLDGYNYDDNTNLLTGQWEDGTPFSINLLDIGTFPTYELIEFHIIPEPATLLLFFVGGIFLPKKR